MHILINLSYNYYVTGFVTELPMDVSKDGVLMAGQRKYYELTALKYGTLQVSNTPQVRFSVFTVVCIVFAKQS